MVEGSPVVVEGSSVVGEGSLAVVEGSPVVRRVDTPQHCLGSREEGQTYSTVCLKQIKYRTWSDGSRLQSCRAGL